MMSKAIQLSNSINFDTKLTKTANPNMEWLAILENHEQNYASLDLIKHLFTHNKDSIVYHDNSHWNAYIKIFRKQKLNNFTYLLVHSVGNINKL